MGLLRCVDIPRLTSALLDGELGPMMSLRVRAHVVVCPPCARYFAQLRAVVDAARRLPGGPGGAGSDVDVLVSRVAARLGLGTAREAAPR
jgi:anti-sigma factor RsiW